MGRLLNSMVEVRVLAVLQIALVACVIAVPAPLGTEVEMLQVAPDIMAVDSMDAMISSAMKAEVKADIGDSNQSDEEMNEEEGDCCSACSFAETGLHHYTMDCVDQMQQKVRRWGNCAQAHGHPASCQRRRSVSNLRRNERQDELQHRIVL